MPDTKTNPKPARTVGAMHGLIALADAVEIRGPEKLVGRGSKRLITNVRQAAAWIRELQAWDRAQADAEEIDEEDDEEDDCGDT